MNIPNYIASHFQPLLGLAIGAAIFLLSCYLYRMSDTEKPKSNGDVGTTKHDAFKMLASHGIAIAGVIIIVSIAFLE